MADAEPRIALDADRPNAGSNDLYNRKSFVRRLTQAVARRPGHEPFIIGIEGSWGEGKSTVLEYMAQELVTHHPDVTLVRFNPWTYQGQDQMLVGLVRVIHEQLKQQPKFQALGPTLLGFVGTTATLIGNLTGNTLATKAGEAGKQWAEQLAKGPSFEKLKQELETALTESGIKIVVLVDDLDRLDHEAIRSVFRLLKAIFDLPSFTYILAYDPDIMAAALESFFDARGQMSGRRYLEKIIQLPLALPKLDPIDLEEDLQTTFEQAFDENALERSDMTQRALRQLTKLLAMHISTPREIRRLGNAIRFALPILKGETNPIDVCRIEALRLLFPLEFEKVLRHPDLVSDKNVLSALVMRQVRARTSVTDMLGNHLPPEKPSQLAQLFENTPKSALSLLAQTFPIVGIEFNLQHLERFQGEFPANDPAYIKRYLQYSIASDDIEDAEVRHLVQVAGHGGDITARLTEMQASRRLERFLEKVRRFGESLHEEQRFQLLRQLAQHTYRQSKSAQMSLAFQDVAIDLLDYHEARTPAHTRWQLLQRILKALPEWWMQAHFFKAAQTLFARYERNKEMSSGVHGWMAEVLLNHKTELFSNSWVNPVTALLLIADQYGRATTEPLVLHHIRSSPEQKREWLLTLARQTYGAHGPVPSAFGLDQYLYLNKVIDVNVLLPEIAIDAPEDPMSLTEEAIAWSMFQRLEELHTDAQEILGRNRAPSADHDPIDQPGDDVGRPAVEQDAK